MFFRNPIKLLTIFVLSLVTISSIFTPNTFAEIVQNNTSNINDYNPNYYYNHETAFIINHALDNVNGGMYVATLKDGSVPDTTIPVSVWGYPANAVKYTDKSHVGQATCIRYLVTEYQRTLKNGVEELNGLLPDNKKITSPTDLLTKAQSCADFAINKMPIGSDQDTTAKPNRLYYWGMISRDGNSNKLDDSANIGTNSVARTETIVPWSITELALALKSANLPYQNYLQAGVNYYNWRQNNASALPDYSINKNLEPGAGRDIFYPNLALNLFDLTGNSFYKDGTGVNADGTPNGAVPFLNNALGTGLEPDLNPNPKNALQDGFYTAGYSRGAFVTKYLQMKLGTTADVKSWWDFGNMPLLGGFYPNYTLRSPNDSYYSDKVAIPFAHVRGRELLAGVQKVAWFNYTNGINPDSFYVKNNSNKDALTPSAFDQAAIDYWNYTNKNLWDDTDGVEAWLEAVDQPYKPCFSGGNDVPIGDWQAPTIADKSHKVNLDGSATVTVSAVDDQSTPYLSWNFAGSGVDRVNVVYSTNNGQNWTTVDGTKNGDTKDYSATIPALPVGTKVLYYAKAKDKYGNWASFPNKDTATNAINGPVSSVAKAVETWDSQNNSTIDSSRAQMYTVEATNTGNQDSIIINPVTSSSNSSSSLDSSNSSAVSSSNSSTTSAGPNSVTITTTVAFGGGGSLVPADSSSSSSVSGLQYTGFGGPGGGLLVRSGGQDNLWVVGGLLISAITLLSGGTWFIFNRKKE